jgi:NAD(P) transhydrogenase subunit beta
MKHLQELFYLIGSVGFISGLKMMGKPDSARKGNLVAAAGMACAVIGVIFLNWMPTENGDGGSFFIIPNIGLIAIAILIGTVIGWMMAKKVKMTAMPEMVSLFNGMGGLCAALISIIEWRSHTGDMGLGEYFPIVAGLIIGTVSFTGSMIAWGKLSGKIGDYRFPFQQFINLAILLAICTAAYLNFQNVENGEMLWFYVTIGLAILYGLLFVFPIGGADMPVVISLLNSFTGVAAACGGFLYHNNVMLMGGILVGSAGTILTVVMCKAMNRSLVNVLIGAVGGNNATAAATGGKPGASVREVHASDVAIMMKYASKVIVVPGYGLAVAQAQHVVHELEEKLEEEGVEVKYAIHPVAGRMPGHMNVLLAESDVSYDKLVEMEDINPEFNTTDVVLVVGANDVVNPAAKTDPTSPIYGMPILDVENAKQIIVLKRSMKSGYAGIDNDLFYNPKCGMLFGDAKESLHKLINELNVV